MKVNGIIAEYNPFHNGHKYQLSLSKEQTGADYTVVVMSGNFVQRGTPALTEKHVRAEMALREGADLVLELPALFATASAEYFATAAVTLLNRLGVVTHLAFGSEAGNIDCLEQIAEVLAKEPPEFKSMLQDYLRQGYSFPSAREASLTHYLSDKSLQSIIKSPNNILAIEYLRALRKLNSSIIPFTVTRVGMGYHDAFAKSENTAPDTLSYGSAFAIRRALEQNGDYSLFEQDMPVHALSLLKEQWDKRACVFPNQVSQVLLYKLLAEYSVGYEKYMDVTPDLSNRIRNNIDFYTDFQEFCERLKTKELTHTRISRCLIHILLNITSEEFNRTVSLGYTPYAKVLGFRKDSVELLSAIRQNASIPLLTKLADAEKILSPEVNQVLQRDVQISSLYRTFISKENEPSFKNEFSTPIVIV